MTQNGSTTNPKQFTSSEYTTDTTLRPKLTVVYSGGGTSNVPPTVSITTPTAGAASHARPELHAHRQRKRYRRHRHQGRLLRQWGADRNSRHDTVHAGLDPGRHRQLFAHRHRHRQQPRDDDVRPGQRDGEPGGHRHDRRAAARPQWLCRRERHVPRQQSAHHRARWPCHPVSGSGQLQPADPLRDLPVGGRPGAQWRGDPVGHARALQAVLQRYVAPQCAAQAVGRGPSDVDGQPDRRAVDRRRRRRCRHRLQHHDRRARHPELESWLGHFRRDPPRAAVVEQRRQLRLAHGADHHRQQLKGVQLERVHHRHHAATHAHGHLFRRHLERPADGQHHDTDCGCGDHARPELHPHRQRKRYRRHRHQGRLLRQRGADRNSRHDTVHAGLDPGRHRQLFAHRHRHRQQPRDDDVLPGQRDGEPGGHRHDRRAAARPQCLCRRERHLPRQQSAHHRARWPCLPVSGSGQLQPADPLRDLPVGGRPGAQWRGDPVGHARALQAVLQRYVAPQCAAQAVGRGPSDMDGQPDRRAVDRRRRRRCRHRLQHHDRRARHPELESWLGQLST